LNTAAFGVVDGVFGWVDCAAAGACTALQTAGKFVGAPFTAASMMVGGPELAAARGTTAFLHGTTTEAAESIVANGLRALSTNTAPFAKGSFFTHAATEEGLIAASHWPIVSGKAAGGAVSVVEMVVPNSVLRELAAQGFMRTGAVPGVSGFPNQTVFLPEALSILNQSAIFRAVAPNF
jgi:hypothetical protein